MPSLELCLSLFFALTILLYVVWQCHLESLHLKQYEPLQWRHVFYCKQCGTIYFGGSEAKEELVCQICTTKNRRLSF